MCTLTVSRSNNEGSGEGGVSPIAALNLNLKLEQLWSERTCD